MSSVTKEKKSSIVAEFGGNPKNTGSIEGQIAVLTEENRVDVLKNINKKIKNY